MKHLILAALLAVAPAAAPALEPAWPELRAALFGDRPLGDGAGVIALDVPYRTENDARTGIAGQVVAPGDARLTKVTVVLDENPMPVSAVFDFAAPVPAFFFDVTMRVNGPTPLHVVAETTDGRLFVAERFVKTSGQGACSAPPGTDPELALATLGRIEIGVEPGFLGIGEGGALQSLAARESRVDIDISHPSHSGMQMDQISLLFIPMRYVESVEVDLDGAGYVAMTGSISLSENPQVALSVPGGTRSVGVTMSDTEGTVTRAEKRLAGY